MSTGFLDRIAFPTGSRLARDDLRDWLEYESRLYALHRAGVHQSWGIVSGLTVTPAPNGRSVRIGRGIGLLPTGSPLVLAEDRDVRPPADALLVTLVYDVVLRPAADTSDCCPRPSRCEGERPISPRARLDWIAVPPVAGLRPVAPGEVLPLARITFRADGTIRSIDGADRRVTQRREPPPMAADRTTIPAAEWALAAGVFRGTIDLPPGRFTTTPAVVLHLSHSAGPPAFARLLATPGLVTATRFVCEARFAHAPGPAAVVTDQGRAWLGVARCHWLAVDVRRCGVPLLPIPPFLSPGGFL